MNMFVLALIAIIILIVFVVVVCTKGSSMAAKQEDYLEKCARDYRKQECSKQRAERTKSE